MFGPLRAEGAKSTSHRNPYVSVKRARIRHVSWAYEPRFRKSRVGLEVEATRPPSPMPATASATVEKSTTWRYLGGAKRGVNLRKSTPNFRLCAPFCQAKPSTAFT